MLKTVEGWRWERDALLADILKAQMALTHTLFLSKQLKLHFYISSNGEIPEIRTQRHSRSLSPSPTKRPPLKDDVWEREDLQTSCLSLISISDSQQNWCAVRERWIEEGGERSGGVKGVSRTSLSFSEDYSDRVSRIMGPFWVFSGVLLPHWCSCTEPKTECYCLSPITEKHAHTQFGGKNLRPAGKTRYSGMRLVKKKNSFLTQFHKTTISSWPKREEWTTWQTEQCKIWHVNIKNT